MASQICRTAIVLCMGVILGGLLADGRSPISIETGGIPIGQYAVVITLTLLLHVVLGHEIPKQVAIDRADACAEMAIPYLRMSRILVFPFVWVILWLRPLLGSR